MDEYDPLTEILPIGYCGGVVEDVFNVLSMLKPLGNDSAFYDAIALELNLQPNYVHLILELLNHFRLTECGTSPRGSWLTDEGERILNAAKTWREKH